MLAMHSREALYLLTISLMPNWNYNAVVIHAPLPEVDRTILVAENDTFYFNMHVLFPEHVPAHDPTGLASCNTEWCDAHTGSKRLPELTVGVTPDGESTRLAYDTAWSPNNETLRRIHELKGWWITNEYEEPGECFEGTYRCAKGYCADEQREYRTSCEICELKQDEDAYDDELDGLICNTCRAKAKLIS